MKRTLILTLAVLAAALLVCALGQRALDGTVDEAERLQSQAVLAATEHRMADAKTFIHDLAALWDERASHDALHDVGAALAEAQICLECEDRDDFLRTMSTVYMGLEHLKDEEAVRLSNLY